MRWAEALEELVALVAADAEILALLGGPHVYETADIRERRVPSIGWTLVFDDEQEATEPFGVQWDVFASVAQIRALEARLRQLVRWRTERDVGGIRMMAEFQGGRSHPVPTPGERHRSFDVRYTPARAPLG